MMSIPLALAGCATAADVEADHRLSDAIVISQDAMACRLSLAADSRYQVIAYHMSLTNPYLTTVAQMSDSRFASQEEIQALFAWSQDVQKCRQRTAMAILHDYPASLANVFDAWKQEDEIFVLIVKRKLSWGDAVERLRTIRAVFNKTK